MRPERWTAAGALAVLAAALLVVPGRPGGPQVSVADATADAPGLPPGRAPAPAAEPVAVAAPVEVMTPQRLGSRSGGDAGTVTTGTLVNPDGDGSAAAASTTAAPPAAPPTTPIGPGVGDTARARFESRFPAHAAAAQDPADPASTRWAVLVGINDHQGSTVDNIGSRSDAESLYAHLIDQGWSPDHVLLLTDELATREAIVEGIRWLARQTTPDSTAVFSYSGHAKQWWGVDMDGDGEIPDEGLWPSDNDHIVDSEFVDLMDEVDAGRLWVNLMACEAAGFLDAGLVRDGRVVTYSSAEVEKSYEDPSVGHSVWGWNLTVQGLRRGLADANGDGDVTVQEAATHAIPRAATRTARQTPYGPQNGGMVDRAGGAFSLAVPTGP